MSPSSTCGCIDSRNAIAFNDMNVSRAVLNRCAVHTTVVSGCRMHNPNEIAPIRNVLPTCRGIDIATVSAAYKPSARFAKIARPAPSCHGSNANPNSPHVSRTAGQPVDTMPRGNTTCLASSDSFAGPTFISSRRRPTHLVTTIRIVDRLNLLSDQQQLPRQRRQIPWRRVSLVHRLRNPIPRRHQQRPAHTTLRRISHRLRLSPLTRSHRPNRHHASVHRLTGVVENTVDRETAMTGGSSG